ncbi:FK506-binding protein [mine drainage metagenome]|uniref:peptidylprolyl isomerase n=1 Tax=mine drainage metagenome TaxID=410659 RepID=A0A1J5Q2H8_9ZZZZ
MGIIGLCIGSVGTIDEHYRKHINMKRILAATICALGLLLSACGNDAHPVTSGSIGPTALQTTDTTVGTGQAAAAGNTVIVNYTGWLYDASAVNFHGAQFDTSVGKAPFQFNLGAGQVIAGWDQGVAGMKVGGTRTLIIPSSLGYGSAGAGDVIPPNAALVFTVDLLAVQ